MTDEVVRITLEEFELEDGTIHPHITTLDGAPSINEFIRFGEVFHK